MANPVQLSMSAFTSLLGIGSTRSPGPTPTYGPAHVLVALLTIGEAGVLGRQALSNEVGLGEGAIRTVIKWLKADDYIEIEANGCRLTSKGKQTYNELKRRIPKVLVLQKTPLTVGKVQVAVLVKKKSGRVKSGIEQRDSSIKAGASGATTYAVSGSRFEVPGSSKDAEKDFPAEAWTKLRNGLDPEDGDVVIVCGSDEKNTSLIGAISAALTLLG